MLKKGIVMATALRISEYILCVAQEYGDLITNLKLQKLLYYAQAWFMVNNNGEKLFEDDIEAWQYGPLVPAVYDQYKSFGRTPIEIECDMNCFKDLCDNVKEFLNEFCLEFFKYSATEMVTATHNEQPWIEAIEKGIHTPIDTELMYKFYSNMLVQNEN